MPRPVRPEKNKINNVLIHQLLAFCCWTEIIFQKHRHAIDKNSPSPLSCIDRLWTCAMLPEQILEQISPRNPQIFCQNPKSSQESSSSTIGQGEMIFYKRFIFPLNLLSFVFWYRQRTKSGQVSDFLIVLLVILFCWCCCWWCLCWCWWSWCLCWWLSLVYWHSGDKECGALSLCGISSFPPPTVSRI